ncbi:MAG: hypothetical protein NC131_11480 [Roseburia sp.]|nr:hypothetical protein [Roseburia sp.]
MTRKSINERRFFARVSSDGEFMEVIVSDIENAADYRNNDMGYTEYSYDVLIDLVNNFTGMIAVGCPNVSGLDDIEGVESLYIIDDDIDTSVDVNVKDLDNMRYHYPVIDSYMEMMFSDAVNRELIMKVTIEKMVSEYAHGYLSALYATGKILLDEYKEIYDYYTKKIHDKFFFITQER